MARAARVVAEGVPHHITQRSNNRQNVFLSIEDRRFYLNRLRTKCNEYGVAIRGYCLTTAHIHLVASSVKLNSLARGIGQTDGQYSEWFNRRYRRVGHLWQNRFKSYALGRTLRRKKPAHNQTLLRSEPDRGAGIPARWADLPVGLWKRRPGGRRCRPGGPRHEKRFGIP